MIEASSLPPGMRLGPYEILDPIGRGGMAEVYRATDTRLGRLVAIKVLAQSAQGRPDRRQRLEREARAISRLSHPNICALFDVGEHEGSLFLVMEYVSGETLAQRLQRGPLAVDAALRHSIEIAEALDHAHRQGMVHRDLKPANIMLSPSGAKLLDFGLAKLEQSDDDGPDDRMRVESATTESLTADGAILGTLPYMSPEQLEGGPADARSDIFAAGSVIFEMITGERAFTGTSRAALVAAIFERDPLSADSRSGAPSASRAAWPPLLRHVVKRCLAKQPEERWQTSADFKRELRWAGAVHVEGSLDVRVRHPRSRARWMTATGGAVALAVLLLAAVVIKRLEPPLHVTRFSVSPEAGTVFIHGPAAPQFVVSPDGNWIAFAAGASSDQAAVWVRGMGDLSARSLPGTNGVKQMFWSPDSLAIAFFAGGSLKIVRLTGDAPPVTLADAPEPEGGAWGSTGDIVFAPGQEGGLMRVSAAGGPAAAVTHLDKEHREYKHCWPSFLPGGRRFLYLGMSRDSTRTGIYVQSPGVSVPTFVLATPVRAEFAAPGYLIYGRESTLMAQPFDPGRATLSGEPAVIATNVAYNVNGRMAFSVSDAGTLVYRTGGLGGMLPSTLQWFDRSGRPLDVVAPAAQYGALAISPAGDRLAVTRQQSPTHGLWLFDLTQGTSRQFVDVDSVTSTPLWSPDGTGLAYTSAHEPLTGYLVEQQISGTAGEATLLGTTTAKIPSSWSRDGRYILYGVADGVTGWDIWELPLFGDRRPIPFVASPSSEGDAQFSPDGRWVLYASDTSGRSEVWVQSFPKTDRAPIKVSPSGGSHPQWRRDGRELYYLDANTMLVAVDVTSLGADFQFGARHLLFKGSLNQGLSEHYVSQFIASGDGRRFLFKVQQRQDSPMTVVLNWTASLPAR